MNRSGILPPGVYELEGGVPLGPAIPPGYEGPPPPAPMVQIIEPVKGWWRQAGAFGQRFTGHVPARVGSVIGLTEQAYLPGPPAPWWFSFFRFNRNQGNEFSPDQGNYDFRGRIIYGVGGIQNSIDVDLIQGVQFPLVCNSATVQLVTVNPYADEVAHPYDPGAVQVTLGVMLGKGGGDNALPVTWSPPIVEAAGGSGFLQTTVIPDFGRSVAVHCSSITPTTLDGIAISFLDLGGTPIATLSMDPTLSYNVLTQEKGVPIPFGANAVVLTGNADTPNGTRAGLQFFLAL